MHTGIMSNIDWTWVRLPRETVNRLKDTRGPNEKSFHAQIEGLLDLESHLKEDMGF